MASVQELLLAAQSKAPKSTFSSLNDLLDTGLAGYSVGQKIRETNVDIAVKLLKIEEEKQQAQYRAQQQKLIDEFVGKREQVVSNSVDGVAGDKTPVTPVDKFERTVSFGPEGPKMEIKIKEPKAPDPVDSYEKALAEKYRKGEITIEEFGKLKDRGTGTGISPSLQYQMQKDEEKRLLVEKGTVIPGYEKTGEVEADPIEVRKLRQGVSEFETFSKDLERYKGLINKYGTSETTDRKIQGQMKALSKSLQLKIKNIAQLGVLSGSDIPFIEEPIPSPGILKTKEGMLGAIESTEQSMRSTIENNLKLSGYVKGEKTPAPSNSDLPADKGGLTLEEEKELAELEKQYGGKP